MSETKTTRKQLPAYLILALIALAAALLLAVTNAITAGPIKAHEEAAQNAAFQSVMTADSFSTMSVPDGYNVTSLVEAKKDGKTIGYCAVSSAKGYGGNVAVTLGVDMDGKIVGCQIGDTNFAETDGFGARWKEPARAEAFIGLSAFGGDTIEAITGATVTSKAVLAASNDVLKCISHVLGKDVEGDVLAFGVKEEKPVQAVELTGDVHQGKAIGFGNGEVTARLTLNDDGTIAALVIDASTQTPGFGTRCADEEFTAQFIGKSGPFALNENVDGLTGATVTSTAAVEAINAALTSPAMAAEDLEPVATEAPAATEAPMVLENAKTATIAGFGGADITVQVTDDNGVITALVVDASTQTAGFGQKCAEEAFTSQFVGKSAPLTLGEGIDAVASATITSQAVVDAVNSLYAAAEPVEEPTEAPAATEEPAAQTAEIKTAKIAGFDGAEITVNVTDEDGVITSLKVDASTQTPGLGQKCAEEAFTAQFIGKSAPLTLGEGIDAVASATITSQAVVDAVNSLYAAAEPVATEAPAATEEPAAQTAEVKTATIAGYDGNEITVNVTDENGVITALTVDASTQTPGLGQKCADEAFTSQFKGKSAPFTLGEGIDAVASATITSQAVVDAVNSLYAAAEPVEEPTEAPAATEEPAAQTAEVKTATAAGYDGNEITVNVTDENGVITSLTVDASTQTPGLGQKCAEEAFTAQFIGKSAPLTLGEGIDAVASATITSQAVVDAVNSLYAAAEPVEEPTEAPAATEEPAAQTAEVKTATIAGYDGNEITVNVTDENGVITALTVDASTQTPGLGQKCADEAFTSQFKGKSAPFTLGEGIDAVASATITSQAVVDAVNSLYAAAEPVEEPTEAPAATEEPAAQTAEVKTATAAGYDGNEITVNVTDENGVITSLTVDASTQTPGLGQKCADEAFTSQFKGKSAPFTLGDGIDAVASATITSQAVVDAVNSLYAEAPAKVLTTKVKGWHEGVVVTVEIDKNHVITALTVDASGEFYALGGKCADEAFTNQFIGKSAPLTLGVDIDAVTGATLTSQAVVDAVNQLAK